MTEVRPYDGKHAVDGMDESVRASGARRDAEMAMVACCPLPVKTREAV